MRPIKVDWIGLQNQFRQQYSKICNTREQLFHAWRSFHFDENAETLDSYVTCIRQVATLLGYGKPHILEVFRSPLPTRLYWVLFPIEDLRQAVETAERILTKEKIDNWQVIILNTIMSIKDAYVSKKVTFDTHDGLEEKTNRLTTMMSKLTAQDDEQNKQFKPKIFQSKRRGQTRNFYNTHDKNYQIDTDQMVEIGEFHRYILSRMEQWLILNNVVNHMQYDRHPRNYYKLDIRAVDQKSHKKICNQEEERQILELDFGDTPEKSKGEYLDMYEGIQSEVISTNSFDENSDLRKAYLGRVDTTRVSKIKMEERFPISEQWYKIVKLLDGTECQILLDTGASKLFMSKSHYLHYNSLHSFPKFASKHRYFNEGNGQFISVLFIIQIIIGTHGHRFKIHTLVSEIHKTVDLVIGIKYI